MRVVQARSQIALCRTGSQVGVVFRSADIPVGRAVPRPNAFRFARRPGRYETCETAGLETCATSLGRDQEAIKRVAVVQGQRD
jgi:hypothetical protein